MIQFDEYCSNGVQPRQNMAKFLWNLENPPEIWQTPPNISKKSSQNGSKFQSHREKKTRFFSNLDSPITTKLPEGFGPHCCRCVAGGRCDDETGRCRSFSGTFGFLRFSSRACHRGSRWRELSRLPEMLGSRNPKKNGGSLVLGRGWGLLIWMGVHENLWQFYVICDVNHPFWAEILFGSLGKKPQKVCDHWSPITVNHHLLHLEWHFSNCGSHGFFHKPRRVSDAWGVWGCCERHSFDRLQADWEDAWIKLMGSFWSCLVLVGGFNFFCHVHPDPWVSWSNLTSAYFLNGLKQTTNYTNVNMTLIKGIAIKKFSGAPNTTKSIRPKVPQ